MELFNGEAKLGHTGKIPTSTKAGVIVFGGHSGVGMMMATEVAKNQNSAYILTVSKRGRPSAPGPAAAFVSAMSCEAVHYMCACDEKDTKAMECLTDWAPVGQGEEFEPAPSVEDIVDRIKHELQNFGPVQLKSALSMAEGMKLSIVRNQRELKRRLQHKAFESEREQLQESLLRLQEQEPVLIELVAELTGKLNAKQTGGNELEPGVDGLLKRLEKELELSRGY